MKIRIKNDAREMKISHTLYATADCRGGHRFFACRQTRNVWLRNLRAQRVHAGATKEHAHLVVSAEQYPTSFVRENPDAFYLKTVEVVVSRLFEPEKRIKLC